MPRGPLPKKVLRRDVLPIPSTLSPAGKRCLQLELPDNDEYIEAFFSVVLLLTKWNSFTQDGTTNARTVAAVWKNALYGIKLADTCDTNDNDGQEFDGEEIMASLCESLRWHNGVLQAWCCGEWVNISGAPGNPVNPDDPGQPGPNEEREYCLQITEREPYLYPVQVNAGDEVSVSGLGGSWSDLALGLISEWYCPNGNQYVLGVCSGSSTADAGDPLPSRKHMGLIASIAGSYYPLGQDGSFIVPPGVTNENMLLLPNTADYANGSGTITACVKVRTGQQIVGITYTVGSGPSSVSLPGTITVSSQDEGPDYGNELYFSECVKITVLSFTGIVGDNSDHFAFNIYDCASVIHSYGNATANPFPATVPIGVECTRQNGGKDHTGGNYTLTLRIEAL